MCFTRPGVFHIKQTNPTCRTGLSVPRPALAAGAARPPGSECPTREAHTREAVYCRSSPMQSKSRTGHMIFFSGLLRTGGWRVRGEILLRVGALGFEPRTKGL